MYLWTFTGGTPHITGLPPLRNGRSHIPMRQLFGGNSTIETKKIWNHQHHQPDLSVNISVYLLLAGHIPVTVGLKNLTVNSDGQSPSLRHSSRATAVDRLTPATLWTSAQWHERLCQLHYSGKHVVVWPTYVTRNLHRFPSNGWVKAVKSSITKVWWGLRYSPSSDKTA